MGIITVSYQKVRQWPEQIVKLLADAVEMHPPPTTTSLWNERGLIKDILKVGPLDLKETLEAVWSGLIQLRICLYLIKHPKTCWTIWGGEPQPWQQGCHDEHWAAHS